MGEIVSVYCNCGYARKLLYVGCGMEYERGGRELFQCLDCHHVLVSKTKTMRKACSKCGGQNLREIDVWNEEQLLCPACGASSMHIEICGFWD